MSPEVLLRLKSVVSLCAPKVLEMSPQTLDLQHMETQTVFRAEYCVKKN